MSSSQTSPDVSGSRSLMARSSVDLPEPLRPDDGDDLALLHLQADVFQHLERAVALGGMPDVDDGSVGHGCPSGPQRASWMGRRSMRRSPASRPRLIDVVAGGSRDIEFERPEGARDRHLRRQRQLRHPDHRDQRRILQERGSCCCQSAGTTERNGLWHDDLAQRLDAAQPQCARAPSYWPTSTGADAGLDDVGIVDRENADPAR